MQSRMKNYHYKTTAIYICVFFAVLLMSFLTPMLADDFSYSFSYADGKRLGGFADMLRSLSAHRKIMNGRIFSHGLAMFFLMLPKAFFNFFNAGNAVLLTWSISRFFKNEYDNRILLTVSAVLLIWIFMPVYGQVFLWLDGALNYAWAMSVILLFIYPFYSAYNEEKRHNEPHKPIKQVLFVLFSFVAGGYSENASCAGIVMAICFCILIKKKTGKLPRTFIFALIAAMGGFVFLMTAPAELGRAAEKNLLTIAKNVQRVVEAPKDTLLVLFCLYAGLLTASLILKTDKNTVWTSFIFFCGSIVSVIVFAFAVYFPWRSLCATTIFLIISCLLLLQETAKCGKLLIPVFASILAMYFLFSFVLGLGDIMVMYMESRKREQTIIAAVEKKIDTVAVPQYSSNTKYAACYLLPDVYEDSTIWPNTDIARYYGVGAVIGLPPIEDFGSDVS